MKKRERVMHKYSKEGIMVNQNLRKLLKIHLQEDHPCSSHKEASIMIMINQNLRKILKIYLQEDHPCSRHKEASIMIMINQGKNSEGLHHKEYHSLSGMKISFMVIVFIVLILDIRLQIAGIIKEMFKQEVSLWPHVTLNVTNLITMDT
jgi:hypothetical protein